MCLNSLNRNNNSLVQLRSGCYLETLCVGLGPPGLPGFLPKTPFSCVPIFLRDIPLIFGHSKPHFWNHLSKRSKKTKEKEEREKSHDWNHEYCRSWIWLTSWGVLDRVLFFTCSCWGDTVSGKLKFLGHESSFLQIFLKHLRPSSRDSGGFWIQ